jgi:hypothetical protein
MNKHLKVLVLTILLCITAVISCFLSKYKVENHQFEKQWGLCNKGQTIRGVKGSKDIDINVIKAWNITKGSKNVIVGILVQCFQNNYANNA